MTTCEPGVPVCEHHWVIETANGPTSWGECQICHEGKEFKNFIEKGAWGDQSQGAALALAKLNNDVELSELELTS